MTRRTLLTLLTLVPALAAAAPGPRGPAPDRLYDPATVATVEGTLRSLEPGPRGRGVHATLETGAGTLTVHLGPASWLEAQPLQLAAGDRLSVTGSRVTVGGAASLVARSVTRGDQALVLRDEAGRPRWAGPARQK